MASSREQRGEFVTEDFLLESEPARCLYQEYARRLPIIDFHSHVVPVQVAANHRFRNLTELWLADDRAKWRVMRMHGVDERYCTGDAPDFEKFQKWAETLPRLLRSPLYHWSHMELKRAFGIGDRLLNLETARDIWETCNAQLARPEFAARGLLARANVQVICSTDDPTDTLEHHRTLAAAEGVPFQMLPTWRPDAVLAVGNPSRFNAWVDALAAAAAVEIRDLSTLLEALGRRHDYFHAQGCRLSDHGLETLYAEEYTLREVEAHFQQVRRGQRLGPLEQAQYKSALLYELALMDHAKGWTQQFHLGALRDCNARQVCELGQDMGFDSVGDWSQARALAIFLDRLNRTDQLARTILYNLHPHDNAVLATMAGNFPDGRIAGKVQHGAAWWFNDHLDGITDQLEAISRVGMLSRFVGMVTDSRSFLSYVRHEYFRRVFCNLLGTDVMRGRLPNDLPLLGGLVRDVCYQNAAGFFGFDLDRRPAAVQGASLPVEAPALRQP